MLKKVNVIYHKPIKARSGDVSSTDQIPSPPPPAWEEDDPIAEKENVDISLLPFNTKVSLLTYHCYHLMQRSVC